MKKYILGLFAIVFVLAPVLSFAQMDYLNPNTNDCVNIVNNLRYRDRDIYKNGEVSTLQDFLQSKGFLNNEPTGYFGLLTFKAVKDFQRSNNINPDGSVGPITKEKIKNLTCDNINPQPNEQTFNGYLSPQGNTVTMWGTHTLTVGNYPYPCTMSPCPMVATSPSRVYSVSANGSQSVLSDLYRYQNSQVTITGQLSWMNLEGGFWGLIASRVVPVYSNSSKPIINGVSGPISLGVSGTGTWIVNATSSNGGNLSYSVDWGEHMVYTNGAVAVAPQLSVQQSATFTHSYSYVGTYMPKFTVTDSNGQSADTSISVRVGYGLSD